MNSIRNFKFMYEGRYVLVFIVMLMYCCILCKKKGIFGGFSGLFESLDLAYNTKLHANTLNFERGLV